MPDRLPKIEYDEHEIVRTVPATKNYVSFKGRLWPVPQAFRGERVAIAAHQIATIDLTNAKPVSHVSEHASAMSPG